MPIATKYDTTKPPYSEYKTLFDQIDEDKSGAVDHDEFRHLIHMLGMAANNEEVNAMIKSADTNGDGTIDFTEFVGAIELAAASGVTTKDGKSFASIIRRMERSFSMDWENERRGKEVIIDPATKTASRTG